MKNKTPIQALRDKMISLGYSLEHQYSLFCAFDEFEKEERKFAKKCFKAGANYNDDSYRFGEKPNFKDFYTKYTNQ